MTKLKSSVPGMPYPSGRDAGLKTGFSFLEGRRKDDRAEGLWRIHDNLYDLEKFIKSHPGGAEWLEITRGTDITEAFEVHHLTDRAEELLPKFFVRKAVALRSLPYTFNPSGFYKTFKKRVRVALKDVDFHHASAKSICIADFVFIMTILSTIAATYYKSWITVVISAIFLTWTVIAGHNFFHLRDNFRMYYFDLAMASSKEWRISHALSHHLYPNTLWDMEIYIFNSILEYLPLKDKTILRQFLMIASTPVLFCCLLISQAIKRYYSVFMEWKKVEFRDIVPFFLPVLIGLFTPSITDAFKLWLSIIVLSSFMASFIGLTSAHHHPNIFHDGDICREDLDWGLMVLDATRDRKVIDDSLFLALTNFGLHSLHHLLPAVDHAYLHLCVPAFKKTCQEFGVDYDQLSYFELVKGQYQQLARAEPTRNFRDSRNSNI